MRARRRNDGVAKPIGALGLALAIAAACGGKSVVVTDDDDAGHSGDGHGNAGTGVGGKGNKGGTGGTTRGGTGGTGGDAGSVGGAGGSGGSVPVAGGSGGSGARGGSIGRGGVGGGAGGGGRMTGGRGGSAGFAGLPTAGAGGSAGTPMAGSGGRGTPCEACNDDDVCTDDLCTSSGMCLYALNAEPCDDDNVCTVEDHCVVGTCLPGEPLKCDDEESCTLDGCDIELGCFHEPYGVAADDVERKIPDSEIDCGPPEKTAISNVGLEDPGKVVWVTVTVELEHPWAGDLSLQLEHEGMVVVLFDRFPGDGSLSSDFGGAYTFATTGRLFEKLGNDVTIPPDTYQSYGTLDAFKGFAAAGDWRLTVSDGCHDDKGSMLGWSLRVGSTCVGTGSCEGACDKGVCVCDL